MNRATFCAQAANLREKINCIDYGLLRGKKNGKKIWQDQNGVFKWPASLAVLSKSREILAEVKRNLYGDVFMPATASGLLLFDRLLTDPNTGISTTSAR